jgi:ribosomal protein S18 acetylase RimI-like enzyme
MIHIVQGTRDRTSFTNEVNEIYELVQSNLKQDLTEEQKLSQGFLTVLYPKEVLSKMYDFDPPILAKADDKVIGYALAVPREFSGIFPPLDSTFDFLCNNVKYPGSDTLIKDCPKSWLFMGSICVSREYRGQGVVKKLYDQFRETFRGKYDMVITDISAKNERSLQAHLQVGFKVIHCYTDEIDTWNVVLWEWN